ncbi:MAG: nucleotidyltransferase domain-containing protein [Ignavibacteriae bacterium]|nr:MAG: nucleotidyltransferase domain-containing protein [Ignavibacteriota bacterium]
MDKKTDRLIRQFIAAAAKEYTDLKIAYIFGSYARNNEKPDSDIDIALFIENLNDADRLDLQVKLFLIASKFDTRIEPHPIPYQDFFLNNPFAAEIKKTGIEITI